MPKDKDAIALALVGLVGLAIAVSFAKNLEIRFELNTNQETSEK